MFSAVCILIVLQKDPRRTEDTGRLLSHEKDDASSCSQKKLSLGVKALDPVRQHGVTINQFSLSLNRRSSAVHNGFFFENFKLSLQPNRLHTGYKD